MEMIVCLFQSMINSEYSSDLGTAMMQLDQETQMVLLKLLQEEQNLTNIDQDSKISDDVLRKFEELETENQKLNQEILLQKQEFEQEKKKLMDDIEIVQTDLEKAQKTIGSLNEDLNQIYELTQTNSVNEVCEYIHNRADDIKGMQEIIQTLKRDQQQEKDLHDIVRELRNKIEVGMRKLNQMQKLEKYCEQLKTQLTESLQEQAKSKENLKLFSKLKEENTELQPKVTQLQQKLDQQKLQQKQNLRVQSQQEFEISKRQSKSREQEIFKLKQEQIDVEHKIHTKIEQKQYNSSIYYFCSKYSQFSIIFVPKAKVSLILTQINNFQHLNLPYIFCFELFLVQANYFFKSFSNISKEILFHHIFQTDYFIS